MKRMELIRNIGAALLTIGMMSNPLASKAEVAAPSADSTAKEKKEVVLTGIDAASGRHYFDGSRRFKNGGPACITCHNVTNDQLIPGGLLAKDLTDVYERMGEGITLWLDAPPFPAMITSYKDHPLTEEERMALTAFFKKAQETKDKQKVNSGFDFFLFAGVGGVLVIMVLINLLWMKRKKQMVKREIFDRQSRAWDAKH